MVIEPVGRVFVLVFTSSTLIDIVMLVEPFICTAVVEMGRFCMNLLFENKRRYMFAIIKWTPER